MNILTSILLISIGILKTSCVCVFEPSLHGVYLTQSIVSRGSDINYLEVVVFPDSIPVWGSCHRRFGNNVILHDIAGSMQCMRCFHIVSRSPHILEVHTEALSTCYTNEGAALTRCPTEERIAEKSTREIMLYKIKGLMNEADIMPTYCPFNGKFSFTYNHNDGTEDFSECAQHTSIISNCPKGNELRLKFRECSFPDFEKSFECLGEWEGENGHNYLALRDPSAITAVGNTAPVPKYRCAMYKVDGDRVYLSFSSDSTCFNNLHSAWEGYETMDLHAEPQLPLPTQVSSATCKFPNWVQGNWHSVEVDGGSITYTDFATSKSYKIYCLGPMKQGLMPVYAKTQCEEEKFTCLALVKRSYNVMELQMSSDYLPKFKVGLCRDPASLDWRDWATQGRIEKFRYSPCPVLGEYTGMIPDASSLCAKLSSDCNNPEIMFYTVSSCTNRSEVYEERAYQCLGQWKEAGIVYTYTKRRDIDAFECFAGAVISVDEVFIAEAGSDCKRGLQIFKTGMKLVKQATCHNKPFGATTKAPKETFPPWWTSVMISNRPTKRFNYTTSDNAIDSSATTPFPYSLISMFIVCLWLIWKQISI